MMKSGFGKAKGRGEERGVQGELMLLGYAWSGGQIRRIISVSFIQLNNGTMKAIGLRAVSYRR